MLIYYCLLALSIVAGIILCRNKAGKIAYCVLFGVVFFIMAAIRYDVGIDYNLYSDIFHKLHFTTEANLPGHEMEKGFIYSMKLLSYIVVDFQWMFVIIGLVIAVGIMIFVCKNSEKPWIGVTSFIALGLFFNSMCFMRQFIAAIIIMYALKYIKTNQFFSFLVLVLFASTIHISALIMIPFYLILRIKIDWISLAVFVVVAIVMYIFSWDILKFVTEFIYTQYDPESSIHMKVGLPWVFVVAYGIVFSVAFVLRKPLVKRNSFNNVLINCMFFATFFEFIGTKHSIISRVALLFFIPPILILTGEIFIVLKEKIFVKFAESKRKRTIAIVSAYLVTLICYVGVFQWLMVTDNNGVVPYQTIFNKPETVAEEVKE